MWRVVSPVAGDVDRRQQSHADDRAGTFAPEPRNLVQKDGEDLGTGLID
jgi:hypothetical protein